MKPQVVSFHCILKNSMGKVLSSTLNNDVITHPGGATETILVGLAEGLQNLVKGERRQIKLTAERAYGFYDPSKVIECERTEIPRGKKLRKGDEIALVDEDGIEMNLRVTAIHGERLILDGNHPLAGQDLVFEIEATDARDCTAEEIQQINEDDDDSPSARFH
ncbi:MAG: FKBP-type peptidyl-prolyl cis-trans isomerase [Bdellovibrionales bacterium]